MFKNIEVRNFRGLENLSIDEASRINFIVGRNCVGKTTVLESIYLLSGWGNPEIVLNISFFRGMDQTPSSSGALSDLWWKPLFSKMDSERTVELTGQFAGSGELALTIDLLPRKLADVEFLRQDKLPLNESLDRNALKFEFRVASGRIFKSRLGVDDKLISLSYPNALPTFSAKFISSGPGNCQEDAKRLGQIRMRKQEKFVVEALKQIEPNLQSIEDSTVGGNPMILGDVGMKELVPLNVFGEGMTRVARLILAIGTTEGGVVLVDEIENGLHHSVLPSAWEAIGRAANNFNTQVFATTHSLECLVAAHSALPKSDLLLHRLETVKDRVCCIT